MDVGDTRAMAARRALRTVLTSALVALLVATVGVRPAHAASWQFTDGFEVNATTTWECWHSVDDHQFVNGCNKESADEWAHGGTTSAWIQGASGWSDIGRDIAIRLPTGSRRGNLTPPMFG